MVDLSEENRLGLLISIPVYFACLACCAVWAHLKEERLAQGGMGSVADKLSAHYLGGRTFGPLITGGTVFASLFSGYAVVGIPNEAFRYGWTALRWIPQAASFSAGVAGAGVRLRILVSGKASAPMPPIDEENDTTGKEIDSRVARKSAGINAILFAITIIIATSEMPGVMADMSFTGPPLSYTVYGPGGGCINANIKSTGITTAAVVMDDLSICETDVLNSPDGPSEAYTRLVVSNCESDTFKVTLYDCKDSACAECNTVPESVGKRNVKQLRRNYYDVDFCRQFDGNNEFDSESESTITYGNETNVSFQRFDPPNTDLSSVQKYYRTLLNATCGAAWFADNIIDDDEPAGGSSSENADITDAQADNSTAHPVADPTTEPPSSATTVSGLTGHWAVLLRVSLLACMIVQLYMYM